MILYTAPTSKAELGTTRQHLKVCTIHQSPKSELACGKLVLHIHASAARWMKNHHMLSLGSDGHSYKFHLWMKTRARRWIQEAHNRLRPLVPNDYITQGLLCIHRYEGSWNDPNSPYWGGLQMNSSFQATYGHEFLLRWGTADHWPVWAQLLSGRRGYKARGWSPWPNTAHDCGLR